MLVEIKINYPRVKEFKKYAKEFICYWYYKYTTMMSLITIKNQVYQSEFSLKYYLFANLFGIAIGKTLIGFEEEFKLTIYSDQLSRGYTILRTHY